MTKRDQISLTVGLIVGLLLLNQASWSQEPGNQEAIARGLLSTDTARRDSALKVARAIGPANTGPALRAALIAALARENAVSRARADVARGGVKLADRDEFYFEVAETVVALREPNAIPALTGAIGTGQMVMKALAEFGERAAPNVLAVVTSPTADTDDVFCGLWTLELMIQDAAIRPLTEPTLQKVRDSTRQRLMGKQADVVLFAAIDLAATLGSADLREIVQGLAFDAREVAARGVSDSQSAEQVRRRSLAALDRWGAPKPIKR